MVQLINLTPTPSQASMLGQSVGQGIAKNFAPPEQLVQRGMLQQALQKAGGILKDQNASPTDKMLAMMEAGAGIPGSEKYLGPLMEKMIQMQAYGASPTGQQEQPGQPQPVMESQQATQQQVQPGGMAEPLLRQMGLPTQQTQTPTGTQKAPETGVGIELGTFVPQDIGAYIDPKQAAAIIKKVGKNGGDPNITKGLINEYNKGLIDYNTLLNSNVDKRSAQIQKQLALEEKAKSFIDNQLSADIPDARKNIYYNLLKKELPNHEDLTSAYQAITSKIQNFEEQVKNIPNSIPEVPDIGMGIKGVPYGLGDGVEKTIQSTAKNLLKTDPLAYPILENMFKSKGHSITQAAKTLMPLPAKVEGIVKSAKDYRGEIYPKNMGITDNQMISRIQDAKESQTKEGKKLASNLSRNWSDEVSVLNIYTDLKSKGWFLPEIHGLFEELEKNGVNFSDLQQTQITQLGDNPQIPLKYLAR